MTPETKQRIKTALEAAERTKYPNMIEHARPVMKVQENSANALTRTIINFLRAEGWQAERISSTGRWIPDKTSRQGGRFIKGSGTKGTADISATIKGKSIKIEVKYGRDRQSDYQRAYQEQIERAGGVYYIARDLDSFLDFYNTLL